MWAISSEMADRLFAISNIVLIAGATAVLAGTIGAIVTSSVRERFADERLSSNEAETRRATADSDVAKRDSETARANAAAANERAALLEKDAAQLRLALEAAKEETERISQGVSSRHVLPAQRALIAAALRDKSFSISIVTWSAGEPEVSAYRDELANAFGILGVSVQTGDNAVTPPQVGLLVIDEPDRSASLAAQALTAAGIDFEYRRADLPNPILRVGIKKPTL
jgi:hypothetical protein